MPVLIRINELKKTIILIETKIQNIQTYKTKRKKAKNVRQLINLQSYT